MRAARGALEFSASRGARDREGHWPYPWMCLGGLWCVVGRWVAKGPRLRQGEDMGARAVECPSAGLLQLGRWAQRRERRAGGGGARARGAMWRTLKMLSMADPCACSLSPPLLLSLPNQGTRAGLGPHPWTEDDGLAPPLRVVVSAGGNGRACRASSRKGCRPDQVAKALPVKPPPCIGGACLHTRHTLHTTGLHFPCPNHTQPEGGGGGGREGHKTR